MTGTIEAVNYAQVEEATSVVLDDPGSAFDPVGAYFEDDELEAL